MTTSSNPNLKRSLLVSAVDETDIEQLFRKLESEQVQCVLDLRPIRHPRNAGTLAALAVGAESREMYYAHLPALVAEASEKSAQSPRSVAWAARTALRHRTCILIRGTKAEHEAVNAVADLVGLRVIDLGGPRRSDVTASDRGEAG